MHSNNSSQAIISLLLSAMASLGDFLTDGDMRPIEYMFVRHVDLPVALLWHLLDARADTSLTCLSHARVSLTPRHGYWHAARGCYQYPVRTLLAWTLRRRQCSRQKVGRELSGVGWVL